MEGTGLRGIRIMDGLTQAEFSKKLGVSQALISDVENGRRAVTSNLRIRIAQTYGTGDEIMQAIAAAKASANLAL
ncbi:helix-turn-helix domain-containing protein [Paenibacillus contaminans]|uniref:Transcriptional regulator n=1 Tax=Paenibacillus contaminans TaxID=450362 RepID=A0A329MLB0_9BACL|nr:helix-turn-helix transcriptional regulator [Paenibacillus contaminans]RAV19503.1 transcriptional regulator [Paenibacillus contaminans]